MRPHPRTCLEPVARASTVAEGATHYSADSRISCSATAWRHCCIKRSDDVAQEDLRSGLSKTLLGGIDGVKQSTRLRRRLA